MKIISVLFKFLSSYLWPFFYSSFSRVLKVSTLEVNNLSNVDNMVSLSSAFVLKENIIKFYRYIYSSFQKNLNFFEKRNKYDFLLSSNLILIYNSNLKIDNVFYDFFKSDRLLKSINLITSSFIDKYRFNNGFFFPKNMYLTTNKIVYSNISPFSNLFPFYLDYYNITDLPIWGADLFFNQNQNVFAYAESSESWFFTNQYNNHFEFINFLKEGVQFNNCFKINFFG